MKDSKGHGSNGTGKGKQPLPGHPYHAKTRAELQFIAKDAGEAAQAMRGHNTTAENKYADQVNDAHTVMGYRDRNGISDSDAKAALHSGTSKSDAVQTHSAMTGGSQPSGALTGAVTFASMRDNVVGGMHNSSASRGDAALRANPELHPDGRRIGGNSNSPIWKAAHKAINKRFSK